MLELLGLDLIVLVALFQAIALLFLARFLDLYERESWPALLLAALLGAIAMVLVRMIEGNWIQPNLPRDVDAVFGGAIAAPFPEEALKGIAIVACFKGSRIIARRFGHRELEGVTDGMVYGAAVGVGFAFAENMTWLLGDLEAPVLEGIRELQARTEVGPLNLTLAHVIFSATVGAALGYASWTSGRRGRLVVALGFGIALLLHAAWHLREAVPLVLRFGLQTTAEWNLARTEGRSASLAPELENRMNSTAQSAQSAFTWFWSVVLLIFAFSVAIWLFRQRNIMRQELAEELADGRIGEVEYRLIPSFVARLLWRFDALSTAGSEGWQSVIRLHDALTHLSFLKWQIRLTGGDWREVEQQRQRVARLRAEPGTMPSPQAAHKGMSWVTWWDEPVRPQPQRTGPSDTTDAQG
jgi:RsiW-degrading membrane proteinase PrsW (M82 family)